MIHATAPIAGSAPPSPALRVALWGVQWLMALLFIATGLWKLFTPVTALAAMIPWAGQVPSAFLHAIGVIDLCGGVGVLLPSLTRIRPGVTVLAALGCAALQACAIVFHVSREETANTPFNFLLFGLALFIAWGRRFKAPVPPRR